MRQCGKLYVLYRIKLGNFSKFALSLLKLKFVERLFNIRNDL